MPESSAKKGDDLTLVIGATGQVGTVLVRMLLDRGEKVRIFHRETSDLRWLKGLELERHWGDVRHMPSIKHAVEGVTKIYHVAGLIDMRPFRRKSVMEVNIDGVRNTLIAAKLSPQKPRVVVTSSIAGVGRGSMEEPATEDMKWNWDFLHCPYHDSKYLLDGMVKHYAEQGLDVVTVNPTVIVGEYDIHMTFGYIFKIAKKLGGIPIYPPFGSNFVDVQDVARGHILAMEKGRTGERYILGGENLKFKEVVRMVNELVGCGNRMVLPLPKASGAIIGRLAGFVSRIVGERHRYISEPSIREMFVDSYASSSKAEGELGYRPSPVRAAFERCYRWLEDNGFLAQ